MDSGCELGAMSLKPDIIHSSTLTKGQNDSEGIRTLNNMKNLIKTNSRVEFHSTTSADLDGKRGLVLGIATALPENNYWIVLLDEPLPDRLAIVITDSCVKLAE